MCVCVYVLFVMVLRLLEAARMQVGRGAYYYVVGCFCFGKFHGGSGSLACGGVNSHYCPLQRVWVGGVSVPGLLLESVHTKCARRRLLFLFPARDNSSPMFGLLCRFWVVSVASRLRC